MFILLYQQDGKIFKIDKTKKLVEFMILSKPLEISQTKLNVVQTVNLFFT